MSVANINALKSDLYEILHPQALGPDGELHQADMTAASRHKVQLALNDINLNKLDGYKKTWVLIEMSQANGSKAVMVRPMATRQVALLLRAPTA